MKQHTQQISATISQCAQRSTPQISATTEPDLPQFGSEDDDETWLTELIGSKATGPHEAPKQAYIQAWGIFWSNNDPSHQNLKTQPGADPVLPRITVPVVATKSAAPCSTIGYGCDLPGPQSQDDDEDSSPIVQELDRAEHTQCSNYHSTLTHSLGASALGSETFISENANLTDSDRKVTPASPPQSAKLTIQPNGIASCLFAYKL